MNLPFRGALAQGLTAMSANPLRTVLSTLGVVMGVASVTTALALADGVEAYAREQIAAKTDAQSITVSSRTQLLVDGFPVPNHIYPTFALEDAEALRRHLGGKHDVTMALSGSTVVGTPTAPAHLATADATLANYLVFGMRGVLAGRYFTDAEVSHNAPVVVLSYKLARELSPDRDAAMMVGRNVRVRGRPLEVIGVMPQYTGETKYGIFVPLRAASAAFGVREGLAPSLIVRAPSIETVDATEQAVIDWLATRYRGWERQVSVVASLAQLEQVRSVMLVLKLVFGAFAGIALVVGGVGIMNVLLASVAERTREIGLRKALGARRRDILFQFLAESIAITGMGAGLGTLIGCAVAFSCAAVVRWRVPGAPLRAAVTPLTILAAVVAATSVGLAFGTFPALRAARLSPIEAIRHD
jgi:putative ABC transport system permease protein